MKNVVFHPLAEQELLDAATYYEEQRVGLGLEYLEEVEHAVNFLTRYPEAGFTRSQDFPGNALLEALPPIPFRVISYSKISPQNSDFAKPEK
jgi:plasmid stabilization system protein ParE